MSNGSIFVVGSLHYDIVLNAPHLPARDETVIGDNVQFLCGGKGGNQAVAASQHGAEVSFSGAVGDDFFADALLENLRNAGVEASQVVRSHSAASGMSVAIVEPDGDYGAVVASGSNQHINATDLKFPDGVTWVVLQNEIPERANIAIAQSARRRGIRVMLNAAPMREMPASLLGNTDVLVVNRIEAAGLFQRPIDHNDDAMAAVQNHSLPCQTIVITLGPEGLVVVDGNHQPRHMRAPAVETISSHGAGDAFVGALCSQLAKSQPLYDSLTYASIAGALHVSTSVESRSKIGPLQVEKQLQGVGASSRNRF